VEQFHHSYPFFSHSEILPVLHAAAHSKHKMQYVEQAQQHDGEIVGLHSSDNTQLLHYYWENDNNILFSKLNNKNTPNEK
jgi:hypothetical protein